MSAEARELARDMERVNRALETARLFLAGLDQADDARELRRRTYSPLRTLIEQAEQSAARVTKYLRDGSRS
ncbi:hypothetical protein [Micromonospora craterilacus]|uniref:hypothetical protein n=1 Tax=Micromonospora craterilacus TaxID=1655439 RepID=UPI001F472D32|nr:hypothetical protein [Micromonospora craterilacus]